MKKFFICFFVLASIIANAQSIQLHQSYNTDNELAPYSTTRVLVDFFWTTDNTNWNVFSWNSIDRASVSTLLYAERKIANSNFYVHPEFRTNFIYGDSLSGSGLNAQLGFSYLIPWENGVAIFLTPKYTYNVSQISTRTWFSESDTYSRTHGFQFSINTAFESAHFYYEGYIDTDWVKQFSVFTEQKAYYKVTDVFQIGACVVCAAYSDYHKYHDGVVQPYLSLRFSLYR